MNRALVFTCGCIAGLGIMILGVCLYFAVAYGHGNLEAGNFHRCTYFAETNSGRVQKSWDTNWSAVEGTEASLLAGVDMWFVGIAFAVIGVSAYVCERAGHRVES